MKNAGTIFSAAFLGIVLILYMCTFQVRFTEVAIRKTWGSTEQEAITEPGLKLKWPLAQTVVKYDKRLRILEDRTEETRTSDGKNLILTTYTLWRIDDPAKFHTNFPAGEEDGMTKLRTTVQAHKHAVVGRHAFEDFVSTKADRRKLSEIEGEIREAVASVASAEYGIEVTGLGIKKLGLPESVTTAIFESMKSHEQAKAADYQARGNADADAILAEARAAESRILSAANQKVQEIRTEAQRVVGEYYKAFQEHPELRIFLDSLDTLADSLQRRTTLIISTKEAPWDVLDESTAWPGPAQPSGEALDREAARTQAVPASLPDPE